METFILKNLKDGVSAVVDYYPGYDSIKLSYSIRCKDDGIYKIAAMSSLKPSSEPIILDTPEFKNSFAKGSKEITESMAAYHGYRLCDIDTFVLVLKGAGAFAPVAVCFCRLIWDFGANEFFLPTLQSAESIERAQKALDSLKTTWDNMVFKEYEEKLKAFKKLFNKA